MTAPRRLLSADGPLAALLVLVPVALTVLAHEPARDGGFTNWDDPGFLLRNPLTDDPLAGGVGELVLTPDLGYPIPATMLGYAAQRAAFGLDPTAYHTVSLILHALVALLACLLARRLGASFLASAAAAAIVAAHPLAVEPVAWVVGQKDLLATALVLAALLIRAGPRPPVSESRTPSDGGGSAAPDHSSIDARLATIADTGVSATRTAPGAPVALARHAIPVVLVFLALAAEPTAVCAPLLLVGVDAVRRRRLWNWANLAVYAATAIAAAVVIGLSITGHQAVDADPTQRLGGASLLQAGWAFSLHAGHLVWPEPLLARYFAPTGAVLWISAILGFLLVAATAGGAAFAWRRGSRATAFGLAGALIAYAPAAGLIPLSRGPADSNLYLPLALAVIAGARGVDATLRAALQRARLAAAKGPGADRARIPGPLRWLAAVVAAVAILTALTLSSRTQTRHWRDAPSLWMPVVQAYPDEPRALHRLGDAYLFTGRPVVALGVYAEIQRRFPDFVPSLINHGQTLALLGHLAEAEPLLARGAREGDLRIYRQEYASFLVAHPDIEPSDDTAARAALVLLAPTLASRGEHPARLRRAIELLSRWDEADLADAVERRLTEIAPATP